MIIKNLQEFYQLCKHNQPIIGLDYGVKKIGIAISNPECTIAMPLTAILEQKRQLQIQIIFDLMAKYKVCAIVMGLPVNMNGEIGAQVAAVMEFVKELEKSVDLPIYLQDERLTTKAANNLLRGFGMTRRKRNDNDDIIAASLILETVLYSIERL